MPAKSARQYNLMAGIAHGWKPTKMEKTGTGSQRENNYGSKVSEVARGLGARNRGGSAAQIMSGYAKRRKQDRKGGESRSAALPSVSVAREFVSKTPPSRRKMFSATRGALSRY